MNLNDFIIFIIFLILVGVIVYNLFYFGRDLAMFPRKSTKRPKVNIYTN